MKYGVSHVRCCWQVWWNLAWLRGDKADSSAPWLHLSIQPIAAHGILIQPQLVSAEADLRLSLMRKEVLVKMRPFKESMLSVHAQNSQGSLLPVCSNGWIYQYCPLSFCPFPRGKIGGLKGQKSYFPKPLWEVWRIMSPEFCLFQTNEQKVEDPFGYDITVTLSLNLRANMEGYRV